MTNPCWLAVLLLESSLVAGLLFVAWRLQRAGVNGPCKLCLCLLLAWRISVLMNLSVGTPQWDYVWGVMFGFLFLYAIHHLAAAIARLRLRSGRLTK